MMFKKLSLIMVMLLLSGLTISCNQSEEEPAGEETPTEETPAPETETSPSSSAPSSPSSQSPTANATPPAPTTPSFEPNPSEAVRIGLIPPTTSKQRKQEIASGRPDPYAVFPTEVKVTRPEDAKNGTGSATSPLSGGKTPQGAGTGSQGDTIYPMPEDAAAVVVSGVMELGGTPIAILTAPGDNGTRHVKPGAKIAGGKVVVKSINTNGKQPFVVLEQDGQEVTKRVGENASETTVSQG